MRPRSLLPIALLLLPALASANGAMGLGLEQWSLEYWFVYVGVTVVFEALYIGNRLGLRPGRSLLISIFANLFTGVFCGAGGLLAPFLHQPFVGSLLDPNPLFSAIALLAIFAIPSGLFEFVFWQWMGLRHGNRGCTEGDLFRRTMLAHLVGIPIGLVILLIPDRPYRVLEGFTNAGRREELRQFHLALDLYTQEHEALPKEIEAADLLRDNPEFSKIHLAGFYRAEYHRFDTGDAKRHPLQFNLALAGKKVEGGEFNEARAVWYLKPANDPQWPAWGIKVDPVTGASQLSILKPVR